MASKRKKLCAWLLAGATGIAAGQSAPGRPDAAEIERREAAAGFLMPLAMRLSVLRLECRQWLAGSDDDVDRIANGWAQRNHEALDAAHWIVADALSRYRSTLSADRAAAIEREMLQVFATGQLQQLRIVFVRQPPTPDTCRAAVRLYKHEQLDVFRIGEAKEFAPFAEFGETLRRTLGDPAFRRPKEGFRNIDARVPTGTIPLATLDAIEMGKERGDTALVARGLRSLVERGDSRAAQTLGIYHLDGKWLPRDPKAAFAWFYNAWVMGETEGINAIGTLLRDGTAVGADRSLALAAFATAQATSAPGGPATQRAAGNLARLAQQMPPSELAAVGCMPRSALHERIRTLAAGATDVTLHSPSDSFRGQLSDGVSLSGALGGGAACPG